MVKTKDDLTGKIFGRLTVIKQVDDYITPCNGSRRDRWLCLCSCENHTEKIVLGSNLRGKNGIKSCGCLQKESASKAQSKVNPIDLDSEDYAIGYTLKGEPFWFDKEDYDLVKMYCWSYDSSGYLTARDKNTKKIIYLHRLLMGINNSNFDVDHKRHPKKKEHKVDNRKSNMQIKTRSQNNMNRSLDSRNTSGVTGVYWDKSRNKWSVSISVNNKKIYIGRFNNKDEAIQARKNAEIKYFGDNRYDANN